MLNNVKMQSCSIIIIIDLKYVYMEHLYVSVISLSVKIDQFKLVLTNYYIRKKLFKLFINQNILCCSTRHELF